MAVGAGVVKALIAASLLSSCVLPSACVRTVYVDRFINVPVRIEYFHSPHDLGYSYCYGVGTPAGWLNVNVYGTQDELGTVLHERKHMEQVKRIGLCNLYNAWIEIPENRIESEAEAFCEEVRLEQKYPFNLSREAAIAKYARWMSNGYPQFRMTPDSAAVRLGKYC